MSRVDREELKAAQKRWGLREIPKGEQCEAAARYAFEQDCKAYCGLARDKGGEYAVLSVRVDWRRFFFAWSGGVAWARQDES